MSFGVGIGDILLVTKIGFTLWVNLKGAQEEREDLTAKLMQWKDKLEIIEPMLADAVKLEPRTVKLAREQLTEALGILENLEHLNRKLVKGKILRQAAWEVRGRATFLEYQTKLEKKLEMLDMLFLSGSMKMVIDGVQETNIVLKRVENGMRYLGFSTPDNAPIIFIDALGYERPLPYDLCLKYEDFRTIVSMCFKESAGKSFVERGEYDITNEESGALLRPEDWTVMAGMKLSMAIIIRKNVKKGERDHRCPACGTQYTGPVGTGYHLERVNCKYCKRWFQITSQIKVVEIDTVDDTEEQNDLGSDSGKPSKDDDLMHIQRFHIRVNEINRPRSLEDEEDQEVGNGRGAPQGTPQSAGSASQAHQLLMANGIDPNRLTPQQFQAFQGQNPITQQRSIQLYAQNLAAHAGRAVTALRVDHITAEGFDDVLTVRNSEG